MTINLKQVVSNLLCKSQWLKSLMTPSLPQNPLRILSIEENEHHDYFAVIQITNKKEVFRMQPHEILANDELTDSFSQQDIRTLTYLGYLGINSPKYKILAQRLSKNEKTLLFAIQERGKKKTVVKSAAEISADENLISGLHQKDVRIVSYVAGTENILSEEKQKQELLKEGSSTT